MDPTAARPPTSAVYLRCYPRDDWAVETLRRRLEAQALALGLSPYLYIDNGISSRRMPPRLADLMAGVASGAISVVLIPGPWVFGLDDDAARRVVEILTRQGCRIIELPSAREARREQNAAVPRRSGRACPQAPGTAESRGVPDAGSQATGSNTVPTRASNGLLTAGAGCGDRRRTT
ncbi:hypothetical protein [Kitasatospora phosalacinea]|uniref:hypothetical protein n=1 Tax=Kitasatospora phosalacinea TaxID=2065 RepID=UPI000526F145|nr:hypothetical protein [Kitasatospora phosalacinea]